MSQPDRVTHPMAIAREQAAILMIDVQERLFPVMDADHREEVMRNLKILTAVARRLSVPMLVTEQYPKGLGHTLPELKEVLPAALEPIEKVAFSCWGVETFRTRLAATGARQLVLAGIEAHVCVLMSALDLLAAGYGVQIVADAVTSRTQANWRLAMDVAAVEGVPAIANPTTLHAAHTFDMIQPNAQVAGFLASRSAGANSAVSEIGALLLNLQNAPFITSTIVRGSGNNTTSLDGFETVLGATIELTTSTQLDVTKVREIVTAAALEGNPASSTSVEITRSPSTRTPPKNAPGGAETVTLVAMSPGRTPSRPLTRSVA